MDRKINDMIRQIADLEFDRAWCMGDAYYRMLGLRILELKKELNTIINSEISQRVERMNPRNG